MLKNTTNRYGVISKCLHWSIALCVIGLIALGWFMVGLDYYDARQPRFLYLHKAFGMLALFLVVFKLAWIAYSPRPVPDAALTGWSRTAAVGMQHILGLLILLIPVSGYFVSTSDGAPIEFFGLFKVPAVYVVGEQIRDYCITIHFYTSYGALALVCGHAGAALLHQFALKDGMLARMLWK